MGEIFTNVILGIIQGFTEFLPISSSGQLELAKVLLGDHSVPEQSLLLTVTLHAATALSTIVVFRKDILWILKGLFSPSWNEEKSFAFKIVISMIPAAAAGILLESEIETFFNHQILLVGAMLILTGVLLLLADRARKTERKVSYLDALMVGAAQAVAILPGLSRSGATISTSVLLGIDREKAARFSFLMVVPLILGKMAKDLMGGEFTQDAVNGPALLVGFAAAFICGYIACAWMIRLVKNSKLTYFSIYCWIVGIIAIAFALFR